MDSLGKQLTTVFKLHIKFITIFIVCSLSLITVYSFICPHVYEASATLVPPDDTGGGFGLSSFLQSLSGGFPLGNIGQGSRIYIFQEVLRSREVAKIITETLKLNENPAYKAPDILQVYDAVGKSLNINLKRTGLLTITATAATSMFPSQKDSKEAAKMSSDIANAAIFALDKINKEKTISKAKRKRLYIERVLTEKKMVLDSLDRLLEDFRKSHKVIAIDDQSQAIFTSAITLGADLAKAEVELNLKLQEYQATSPIIKLYKEKVENLKEQYSRIQRGGITSSDAFSIPLEEVPALIRQYSNLYRDQKILEQVNLYLETQKYQEAIQEQSDVIALETLDKAVPPVHRESPNRKIMLVIGFFISSILSLTFVVLYSIYKGKIILKKAEKV